MCVDDLPVAMMCAKNVVYNLIFILGAKLYFSSPSPSPA